MSFDELFEQRNLVASKLRICIRDKGYTKVSFSEKTGISRPTLDKLLEGSIDNKTTFNRHLQKILGAMNLSARELLLYSEQKSRPVTALYSQNAPEDHKMSDVAKKQYDLLLDIVDLCSIYY